MLRHTEPAPAPTSLSGASPANVAAQPFTADEIAHAIAELEKERSLKESAQNGSSQISDILDQLDLKLAPGEVAAKIEQERTLQLRRRQTRRKRRALFATLGAAVACLGFGSFLLVSGSRSVARPVVPLSQVIVTQETADGPMRTTLAEIPNGTTVSISGYELGRLLRTIVVNDISTSPWHIERENGVWYLIGYTDAAQSPSALLASEFTEIQSTPNNLTPMMIRVPIDDITVSPGSGSYFDGAQLFTARFKNADRVTFEPRK